MNEIVQMHNDLVDLPLKNFNRSELDILHTICYEVKNRDLDEVEISFDKIRQLSHYQNKNETQLVQSIKQTNEKLLKLNFQLGDDRNFVQFVLFPTFIVSSDDQTLTVKVNEPFKYLLNNFGGNYTTFELEQSSKLRSSYSKQIFKKLKEFDDTGIWQVTLEGFREYLDIPKSYRVTNIDQFVINPSLDELQPLFKKLECEKYYEKSASGRGRPSLRGYRWTFTPVKKEKEEEQPKQQTERDQEYVAKITDYIKTNRFCPECHRPIYRLELENDHGEYQLYGHADWKTGKCQYRTFDYGDLLQKHQLPEDPLTEEQKKNKSRLADMISSMFGRKEQ